jgi:hypothetical protein
MYVRHVGLAMSLRAAISKENFLSLEIAISNSSDKYLLFSRLSKHRLSQVGLHHTTLQTGIVYQSSVKLINISKVEFLYTGLNLT